MNLLPIEYYLDNINHDGPYMVQIEDMFKCEHCRKMDFRDFAFQCPDTEYIFCDGQCFSAYEFECSIDLDDLD